jgi:hypothetical protein
MSDLEYFEVDGIELHDAKIVIAVEVHEPHLLRYDEDYLPRNYKIMVAIDNNAVLYIKTYSEGQCKYQTIYNGSYSIILYPKGD